MHGPVSFAIGLLLAAVVCVPLTRRLGLGSVLGYLLAGIVVGPLGFRLVEDAATLHGISELGVVLLLFVIGLELQPARLWVLRRPILLLGSAQMLVSAVALALVLAAAWNLSPGTAFLMGLALAMSSTALVLQLLSERQATNGRVGRDAFVILLFQDMAVIPLLAVVPLLASGVVETHSGPGLGLLKIVVAGGGLLLFSRYLLRPTFKLIAEHAPPEIFTATALLVVLGTAALMESVGLSMTLGAFLAGVLLADSEYRHELEAQIEPFKGLLLGLFFITVGVGLDLRLLFADPRAVLGFVVILLSIKGVVLMSVALLARRSLRESLRLATLMSQGGEFAFVLLALMSGAQLLSPEQLAVAVLAVSVSMALTPLLNLLVERLASQSGAEPQFDMPTDEQHPVLIAGFGRVGQIIGRILRVRGIGFTALEIHPEQVDRVRRFGTKIHFGDASRLELLRAAGAASARLAVVTLGDPEQSLRVVDLLQRHFPHLQIIAAAKNRQHALRLYDRGITDVVRHTFFSSLALSERLLVRLGHSELAAAATVAKFREHDEKLLLKQQAVYHDEKLMIQSAREMSEELESLFEGDLSRNAVATVDDPGPVSGVSR